MAAISLVRLFKNAPNDLNIVCIGRRMVGFGALIQPDFYQADLDVYHLGNLGLEIIR